MGYTAWAQGGESSYAVIPAIESSILGNVKSVRLPWVGLPFWSTDEFRMSIPNVCRLLKHGLYSFESVRWVKILHVTTCLLLFGIMMLLQLLLSGYHNKLFCLINFNEVQFKHKQGLFKTFAPKEVARDLGRQKRSVHMSEHYTFFFEEMGVK